MNFLNDDRGSSLISNLLGAIIGFAVVGLMATSLYTFMNAYIQLSASQTKTAQKTNADHQFRSDVMWALNIPSASAGAKSFTLVSKDSQAAGCQEISWSFVDAEGRTQLVRESKVFELSVLLPGTATNPVTSGSDTGVSACSGHLTHQTKETIINDAGAAATFEYVNIKGVKLTRSGAEMTAPASSLPNLFDREAASSSRIAGVVVTSQVASSGGSAENLSITQFSENLQHKDIQFVSNTLNVIKLGGSQ